MLFSGSLIARRSQCCMHADTSKFSSGSSTGRLWFNVCRQVVSPEWAGRRTLKYMARQSKKQTVYSTCWESATFSPWRICLFPPLKSSVVIESNTNRNICSMENTKIKAKRVCKLLFTKKQAKEKRSCSVRRSPIHSLCVSHGYEPTPRLFRTKNVTTLSNTLATCLSGGAPQASYDKRRHRNCFQTWPLQANPKKETSLDLGSEVSWCDHRLAQTSKEAFSEVRVHAGTTQVDFEVERPPPADSPPGDLLITMVKETVILHKKEFRKNEKTVKLNCSYLFKVENNSLELTRIFQNIFIDPIVSARKRRRR